MESVTLCSRRDGRERRRDLKASKCVGISRGRQGSAFGPGVSCGTLTGRPLAWMLRSTGGRSGVCEGGGESRWSEKER